MQLTVFPPLLSFSEISVPLRSGGLGDIKKDL
jgi:hypothetical protein